MRQQRARHYLCLAKRNIEGVNVSKRTEIQFYFHILPYNTNYMPVGFRSTERGHGADARINHNLLVWITNLLIFNHVC